jgi:hypothetical protein
MFKHVSLLSIALVALTTTSVLAQDATWEYQGRASTGEKVSLNLDSIQVVAMSLRSENPPSYWFTYQIGNDRLTALTPCDGRFQVSQDGVFGEFMTPQSGATRNMLDRVCRAQVKSATVFAPPSNVRASASTTARIRCVVEQQTRITTYGTDDDWFYTNACGKTLGLIHSSQIRFD